MTHPAFQHLRSHPVPALRLEFQEYRHRATGARHLHLAADDPHNAFMVAFLTVPRDSTGVAHILEHTSLCGSRRYPVRDPFFMMIRRSLNTFMNAFTSSDPPGTPRAPTAWSTCKPCSICRRWKPTNWTCCRCSAPV